MGLATISFSYLTFHVAVWVMFAIYSPEYSDCSVYHELQISDALNMTFNYDITTFTTSYFSPREVTSQSESVLYPACLHEDINMPQHLKVNSYECDMITTVKVNIYLLCQSPLKGHRLQCVMVCTLQPNTSNFSLVCFLGPGSSSHCDLKIH